MVEVQKYITDLTNDQDASLDKVDEGTGLTKRERLIVQKTWEEAGKNGQASLGMALFNLYFDRYPEYIGFFRTFKDIPREQLRTHVRLKAHGLSVAHSLTGVIAALQLPSTENLEDPETAVLLLEKTGRDHVRRKIHSKQFEDLQTTTVALLQTVLGSGWTPLVERSWNKALTVVMTVILKSLQGEEKAQNITD